MRYPLAWEVLRHRQPLDGGKQVSPVLWPRRQNNIAGSLIAANVHFFSLEAVSRRKSNGLTAAGHHDLGGLCHIILIYIIVFITDRGEARKAIRQINPC